MKTINLQELLTSVTGITGATPETYPGIKNDSAYVIPPGQILAITQLLMEEFDCTHLSGITAQQREGQRDVIEVLYHFWKGVGFSFLMKLPADSPELPSITAILPGADFYEREVAEMFGITFSGREETPPLLLPDDWSEGPPFMRREENNG
jgi:NADH-quinone oxidoreductase subunit C